MQALWNKVRELTFSKKLSLGFGAVLETVNRSGIATAINAEQLKAATLAASASRTVTAAGTITAADHGTTIFINNATGFATTLPAPIAGFKVTVINMTANTSGNHTVVTSGSSNIIAGGLNDMGGAAGSVLGDGDTISFVANASVAGDRVDLVSNGTTWFLSGATRVATGVTVTKAT